MRLASFTEVLGGQAASLRLTFTQRSVGRRAGHRCEPVKRDNRRARRCSRTLTDGSLQLTAHRGRNTIAFQGRISRGVVLAPGSYTVSIAASNEAGRSQARELRFTVVK